MRDILSRLLPPAVFYLVSFLILAALLPWAAPPEPEPLPPAGTLSIDRYLTLGTAQAASSSGAGPMSPRVCPAQGLVRTPEPVSLPILMCHDISETGKGGSTIAYDTLRAHLLALKGAGYHTVSLQQIADFVLWGEPLPDKPILLTFDDGYLSNYEKLFPLLEDLNIQASIFLIGVHTGRTEYKGTCSSINPHFSYAQAREMLESGLVSLGSHTYDMHRYAPLEPKDQAREGVLPLKGEGRSLYCLRLAEDFRLSSRLLTRYTGEAPIALAYPQGLYTPESEAARRQAGYLLSFTVEPEINVLRPGAVESLSLLGRYSIDDISAQALLKLLNKETAALEQKDCVTPCPEW